MALRKSIVIAADVPEGLSDVPVQGDRGSRGRPPSNLTLLVGRIDGKLDQIIGTLVPQVSGLDDRVQSLEVFRGRVYGAVGTAVSFAAVVEGLRYAGLLK